ncbi:MAG: hypothetical protein R3F43_11160 [bacterium]
MLASLVASAEDGTPGAIEHARALLDPEGSHWRFVERLVEGPSATAPPSTPSSAATPSTGRSRA